MSSSTYIGLKSRQQSVRGLSFFFGALAVAGVAVAVYGLATGAGNAFLIGLLFVVFAVPAAWLMASQGRKTAHSVTLDPAGIRGTSLLGSGLSLAWDDVAVVKSFSKRTGAGSQRVIVLKSEMRQEIIHLQEPMTNFDQLTRTVSESTRHAREEQPTWRELLV
jgi:hypothetical protein